MSRSAAQTNDLTGVSYLETGAEIVRSTLVLPSEAVSKILGFASVCEVMELSAQTTTGSFYRRWANKEEYQRDLAEAAIKTAFSSPERNEALRQNALAIPRINAPDSDSQSVLEIYRRDCAEMIIATDPHLLVRWHARPYLRTLGIEDAQGKEAAENAIVIANALLGAETATEDTLSQQAKQLAVTIDVDAVMLLA